MFISIDLSTGKVFFHVQQMSIPHKEHGNYFLLRLTSSPTAKALLKPYFRFLVGICWITQSASANKLTGDGIKTNPITIFIISKDWNVETYPSLRVFLKANLLLVINFSRLARTETEAYYTAESLAIHRVALRPKCPVFCCLRVVKKRFSSKHQAREFGILSRGPP